jgi:chromosome partitioning protein
VLVLLNRAKAGTRLLGEVETAIADLGAARSAGSFGNRIAYAEALGTGHGVTERGRGPWTDEVEALVDEIEALLSAE